MCCVHKALKEKVRCSSYQWTRDPGCPVGQHTVLRAGQLAVARPQRHLLRVTQVVLRLLRGPVDSVQHTSGRKGMQEWVHLWMQHPII